MNKYLLTTIILMLFLFTRKTDAQLPIDSWCFGFGGTYPRFANTNLTAPGTSNYGGFLSIQRNFSEHVGLRVIGKYLHLEGKYGTPEKTSKTTAYTGSLDFVYYFVPCESISPFFTIGIGGIYFTLENKPDLTLDKSYFDYQVDATFGIEWKISSDWKFKTEFGYHTASDNKLDGQSGAGPSGGILGGPNDTYMSADVGFLYYFEKGIPSKYCQIYSGLTQEPQVAIDYNRIEDIVKRNIPSEVEKQVVVTQPVEVSPIWILVGVNFDFNSAELKPEAYPILLHAVQTLLRNQDLIVEIQGHTDNIGTEKFNELLSVKRAQTVKNYLIARGISSNRLHAVGYGETMPIADNSTAEGRAINRRIEFKILK